MRALAAVVLVAMAGSARAAETVQCTATEVLATKEKRGLDPRLDSLKTKLLTPQFSAWDTFKLLGETRVAVEQQKPKETAIQYGRLTLLYKDKEGGGRPRLHMSVALDDRDGRRQVTMDTHIDVGDRFLTTGLQYMGGQYILILGCAAP
jgi:hypothetical protein